MNRYYLSLIMGLCCLSPLATADERPNIILIMADDLGYGDIGRYGQSKIKTPHLDKLADEGMRFTQHYAGSTVCGPSRASLLTGRHTGRSPIRGNPKWTTSGQPVEISSNQVTLGQVMQQSGYQTALIGKWGMADGKELNLDAMPNQNGFDFFYGYKTHMGAHHYYWHQMYRNNDIEMLAGNGYLTNTGVYTHDLFTQEANNYIKHREKKKPFFMMLSYTIPHKAKHNEDITYFYADRFDEKYDTSRAIRDGKYKYIFNFKPHYPQSLYNNYRYKQAAYQELAKLNRLGKLEGNGADFFQPKPMEALYDISVDPNELNNLAKTPEYANKTKALRTKLFNKMFELQDLALLPESFYINAQKTNNQYTVAELNALQKDLIPFFLNSANFQNQHTLELLSSNNSWLRYWTIQRLHQQPLIVEKKQIQLLFNMMTTDTSPYVQSAAFELLSAKGIVKDTSHWQRLYDKASSDVRRLELLNIATYLYELRGLVFQPRDDYKPLRPTHKSVAFWIDKRWAYLTSDIAGR